MSDISKGTLNLKVSETTIEKASTELGLQIVEVKDSKGVEQKRLEANYEIANNELKAGVLNIPYLVEVQDIIMQDGTVAPRIKDHFLCFNINGEDFRVQSLDGYSRASVVASVILNKVIGKLYPSGKAAFGRSAEQAAVSKAEKEARAAEKAAILAMRGIKVKTRKLKAGITEITKINTEEPAKSF